MPRKGEGGKERLICTEVLRLRPSTPKRSFPSFLLPAFVQVARLLIKWGAPLDDRDKFLQTPAHWAAWNGHADLLQLLLQHGADANSRDTRRCTPLYNAAKIGEYLSIACRLWGL